jgi:hypothetical protein
MNWKALIAWSNYWGSLLYGLSFKDKKSRLFKRCGLAL